MTSIGLVAFHHAGGGSASWHPLRRALAETGTDVDFVTATLPGRESRRAEPRHADARRCVEVLARELDSRLAAPHVLIGHSMGALLAYGVAQQRISHGLRPPEAIIVASSRAPHRPGPIQDLDLMTDHELAAQLARYGGIPREILDRPEWIALLMPTVRDDLRIVQSFPQDEGPLLTCPLHVFGGFDDSLVPPDELAAWASLSVLAHPVRLYSGGHFPFRSPDPELVTAIAGVIAHAAPQRIGLR